MIRSFFYFINFFGIFYVINDKKERDKKEKKGDSFFEITDDYKKQKQNIDYIKIRLSENVY